MTFRSEFHTLEKEIEEIDNLKMLDQSQATSAASIADASILSMPKRG